MHAVLFDIDGTLVQTGGAGSLAFERTFAEDFGITDLTAEVAFAGRTDRAISLDFMAFHGIDPSGKNWTRFRDGYLRRLPDALAERRGAVLPGILALLAALDSRADVAVGLLTGNIARGAALKLGHYGLGDRFPFGGFGDDATDRNEVAASAQAAAVQHHGALRSMTVIGDTEHDVACARSIGACAVAVATGGTPREALAATDPDLLLDDLADIRTMLDLIDNRMNAKRNGEGSVAI